MMSNDNPSRLYGSKKAKCSPLGFAAATLELEGTALTPLISLGSLGCAIFAAILGALVLDVGAVPNPSASGSASGAPSGAPSGAVVPSVGPNVLQPGALKMIPRDPHPGPDPVNHR